MAQSFTISRREFNDLYKRVDALWKMNVESGTGLELSKSRSAVSIKKAPSVRGVAEVEVDIKPVTIVKTIADGDTSMTVRIVAYADTPPGEALRFVDAEFTAYPYWGDVTIDDYRGLEFTGETPDTSTTVFDARKDNDIWILSRPSIANNLRIARVVSTAQDTIFVQPLRETFSGDGRTLEPDGDVEAVPVWPKLNGNDYRQHIAPGVIILLLNASGTWYAYQTIPLRVLPKSPIRRASCPLSFA